MSKGSEQRPCDREAFNKNYDAIFGQKPKEKTKEKKDKKN
jgi:hypothetical protein|tara:strand:+ start:3963 stop:4082 length:120 start_codon:yes stop_codon:yes gene_type:complete